MTFKPFGDRLLVQEVAATASETASGLIIPEVAKEKPQEGVVVAAGDGRADEHGKLQPMYFKVGDKVLYGKYSGAQVKVDGVEYLIIHQDDILGHLIEATA